MEVNVIPITLGLPAGQEVLHLLLEIFPEEGDRALKGTLGDEFF
jgi:hypothetical protein